MQCAMDTKTGASPAMGQPFVYSLNTTMYTSQIHNFLARSFPRCKHTRNKASILCNGSSFHVFAHHENHVYM